MPSIQRSWAIDWQPHHFITGWMCLDFMNTRLHANDPARRVDRLASAEDVEEWRAEGWPGCARYGARDTVDAARLRGAIEGYFRPLARGEGPAPESWAHLARLYAEAAGGLGGLTPAEASKEAAHPSFEAALLHSAVTLAFSGDVRRLGECEGCDWLFVDRTRNRSKRWCTSHLCGNRAKARRHYARVKAAGGL